MFAKLVYHLQGHIIIFIKLCIKNNWYTCGTTRKYEQLFEMNSNGATHAELAMNIWLNSTKESSAKAGLIEIETESISRAGRPIPALRKERLLCYIQFIGE